MIGQAILLTFYFIPAGILMLFGLNLLFMLRLFAGRYATARREQDEIFASFHRRFTEKDLPHVVTQLPLFNEYNVAERVIRAAAAMDYPAGRHTVQVLDDSTDETRDLVDRVCAELRAAGRDVQVLRRPHREGYKAGALSHGMAASSAGFFAIFDADFVPPRDFLMRTVPVMLARPGVGIVQARWGHLNDRHTVISRAQAIGIDGHFAIEQPARAWNELFMNFNGTAGLWRRQAIEDAGGWQHDTLTEDMDLSYRSQLAGWKPFFLFDLVVPAELPSNINAFKVQQFRWAKGSIQTALKLLPRVFRAPIALRAKVQAAFHMLHYVIHPLMLCVAFMALPVLHLSCARASAAAFAVLFAVLILSMASPMVLYAVSQRVLYGPAWGRRIRALPLLTSLGIGIAISNTRAVLEALLGVQSGFIRTPKRGTSTARLYSARLSYEVVFELLLGAYCFLGLAVFLAAHKFLVAPFMLLYAWGFTAVGLLSIVHFLQESRWARAME